MSFDSDSSLIKLNLNIAYTRDVQDTNQGFARTDLEHYHYGQHWLKVIHFFDQSFSPQRWKSKFRDMGCPNEGKSLLINSGEWFWKFGQDEKYLVIGIHEHTIDEVAWLAVHHLPTGWEVLHQDGSTEELLSGKEISETFHIGKQYVRIKFYNPVKAGNWTNDDMIYEIEKLEK